MPYRAGRGAGPPTHLVLCVACGKPAELTARDDSFRCSACDRVQAAVRPDGAAPLVDVVVGFQAAGHSELVPFAKSMGIEDKCAQISLKRDGVICDITLELNSGTACGLDLGAQTDGFPEIAFTRETGAEHRAKASGLSREVQTGDRDFDESVYVESDVRDDDLLVVLRPPAVRVAIVQLLQHFKSIKLTAKGVELTSNRDEPTCYDPTRILQQLAALRVLAGAPRPIRSSTVSRSTINRLTPWVALTCFPAGIATFVASMITFTPLGAMIVATGLGAGFLVALTLQPVLRWAVKGFSASHRELAMARMGVIMGLPLIGAAVAVSANALLDESPERVSTMRVVAVEWDAEDSDTNATLRGPDTNLVGELELSFDDDDREMKVGDTATVWTRAGALGYRWYSRSSVARLQGSGRAIDEN